MRESLLKKAFKHRIMLSIVLSETGRARSLTLHSFWCVATALSMVGGVYGYGMYKEFEFQQMMAESGQLPKRYEKEIDRLNTEKGAQEKQIMIFAQELGILQARLDRFDAISEKLFSDPNLGEHLSEIDSDLDGKGGLAPFELETAPSLGELQSSLSLLQGRTERLDGVMNSGLEFVASSSTLHQKPSVWPVIHPRTRITSLFGKRSDPVAHRGRHHHSGLDIGGGYNAPIVSAADGVIVFAGYRYNYGITVEIRHANGFSTRYAHMNEAKVKNGEQVKAGDLIGLMGSTGRSSGPHLHFEVLMNDVKVDPLPFVKADKDRARLRARQEKTSGGVLAAYLK